MKAAPTPTISIPAFRVGVIEQKHGEKDQKHRLSSDCEQYTGAKRSIADRQFRAHLYMLIDESLGTAPCTERYPLDATPVLATPVLSLTV